MGEQNSKKKKREKDPNRNGIGTSKEMKRDELELHLPATLRS